MEEIARRNEASLFPERGLTLSPAVDATLRDRIHSLLTSRNQQNPPKTTCPSPDLNYSRRVSEENRSAHPPHQSRAHRLSSSHASVRLAQPEKRLSDMGATRFDGPAGQVEDNDSDILLRRSSQPASGEWQWSNARSGLNQRAHGDILGREAARPASMDRKTSSASRGSTGSHLPRYHLRTVPPATDVNKVLRPNPLHVPGSYRSEVNTRKGITVKITSVPAEKMPEVPEKGVLATPFHANETHDHTHQAAADALRDIAKHDRHQNHNTVPEHHADPSQATLRSIDTAKESDQLLPRRFANQSTGSQVGQPMPTSGETHKHIPEKGSDAPVFIIGDDHDASPRDVDLEEVQDDQSGQPEHGKFLSGPQISDLLAEMPPIRQSTWAGISKDHSNVNVLPPKPPSQISSAASSLHSIPSNKSGVGTSPVSPMLARFIESAAPVGVAGTHDEMTTPLIPNTRRSSQATGRFSSVGRAMSILSDLSARSGVKVASLPNSIKHMRSDSASNLTTRPASYFKNNPQARPVREGYKTLVNASQEGRLGESDGTHADLVARQTHQGEGFAKGITDLESLMTEALDIAGKATSREHSEAEPLFSKARPTRYHRLDSEDSAASSDCLSSLSGGADEENNHTTQPRNEISHSQKRVVTKSPENDALDHGRRKKAHDATPYPARMGTGLAKAGPERIELTADHQGTHRRLLDIPQKSLKAPSPADGPLHHQGSSPADWAVIRLPSNPSKLRLEMKPPPPAPQLPPVLRAPVKEQHVFHVRNHGTSEDTITRNHIRDYVNSHQRPPVQARLSSMRLRSRATQGRIPKPAEMNLPDEKQDDDEESDCECVPYVADFETSGLHYHPVFQDVAGDGPSQAPRQGPRGFQPRQDTLNSLRNEHPQKQEAPRQDEAAPVTNTYGLEGRHHFSIREPRGFSLSRSHRRSPIARDWGSSRKRYTATVVCITTAFMGLIIGIYAGEVPAIQYAIADEHHYAILGNVLFFIGLAITTALFYPLPLLHGRKPYTLAALAILLPLQFPQALAITRNRSPYVATYRVGLLLPRVFAGIVMGFANINFITTLLDLYGSSLQSGNPHQETVNENDVRRHGGGMGVWLSIWTWCAIGSIGLGFLIGAGIIGGLDVSWGFWILIILNAIVLVLNILSPEVRRSAYRRSMAEVRSGGDVSRRIARGEIKMHLASTGPVWWWEEVWWGHVLAFRMLKQPGFALLALYLGWIYGQVVLVIVLLGALLSKYYHFHPQYVGLAVGIIPLGALLAVPFQKASLFSRARHRPQRTDSMTFEKRVTWTSHLVRRSMFMISLPFADMAYTLASGGRPTSYVAPIIFAGLIGFLSNLAIAECNGIIMETFDTSDLQPGMTGRPRRVLPEETRKKRTNFSSFPRVTAGFAVAQTFAFAIGAATTAWGGVVERHVGAQTATGAMAGVLLVLTLLLIAALFRFKTVQIIPSERFGTNILSGPEDEWKPIIIGNPSGTTRRMSLLELGDLSRWSEIRRRNKLVPEA